MRRALCCSGTATMSIRIGRLASAVRPRSAVRGHRARERMLVCRGPDRCNRNRRDANISLAVDSVSVEASEPLIGVEKIEKAAVV